MGWTFQPRPRDVKQHLIESMTWEAEKSSYRCIDRAMKLNVAYAAVEQTEKATGKREVWAAVILLRYVPGEYEVYNFGTKEMTEHMGPCQSDCAARILDKLTTTDCLEAIRWREACRESIRQRMPRVGTRVRFKKPVRFTDGSEETEFEVVKVGRRKKALRGRSGRYFRLPQYVWQQRPWQIVPDNDPA